MKTRFPICSGWKADWEQGYNMPIKYHLKQKTLNQNEFQLTLPLLFTYQSIVAEKYNILVTLPTGAYNISVDFPYSYGVSIDTEYDLWFGTLDIIGRPVVKIDMPNANSVLHKFDTFKINYKVDQFWSILIKPLGIVVVIFGFLICFLISFRF